MPVFFLIYVSSATHLFTEAELRDLLEVSRRNNSALGVTGMLLYKDGNFMQFLEGEKEKVLTLSARIEKDPRHKGMITLLQQDNAEREFPEWSMGYKKLGKEKLPEAPGYSDFLDLPLTSETLLGDPSKSLKLLLNFKNMMR